VKQQTKEKMNPNPTIDLSRREPENGVAIADQTAPTSPPPPARAGGIKKISFGAMTKKADTKTAYPVYPDQNKEAALIAARIVERSARFDELEGQLKTDKAELKLMVSPFYFATNRGKGEIPSSVAVHSAAGEVLVSFTNRYPKLPDETPLAFLDPALVETYFAQTFEIKIKGDALPQDPAICQTLLDRLQSLFAEFNATDALQASAGIAPKKNFHEDRHRVLTVEQNLAVDAACPMVAMVKTKGRK